MPTLPTLPVPVGRTGREGQVDDQPAAVAAVPSGALPSGARPSPPPTALPGDSAEQSGVARDVQDQLTDLPARPVDEHVAAYERVHRLLQDELTRLDED